MQMDNAEPAKPRERVAWLDIARGASILLVVLYHATYDALKSDLPVWRLHWLNEFLEPVRLPTFFLVSGLLAAGILAAPLKDFLIRRVWLYLWLFVLWKAIRWVYYGTVVENVRRPSEGSYPAQILEELYRPVSGIWFLWALLVFFIVARLGRRIPNTMLAASAALSMLVFGEWLQPDTFAYERTTLSAVFFLAGAYYRDRLIALIEKPTWATLPLAVIAFGLCTWLAGEVPIASGPLRLIQCFSGVIAACRLSIMASRLPIIRRPLVYLGQNTLPIYVAHALILMAFITSLAPWVGDRAQAYLLVGAAIVIAVPLTLAAKKLADAGGLRFLYTAPAIWKWLPVGRVPRLSAR